MADTAVQQSPSLPKTPTKAIKKKTPLSDKGSEAPKTESPKMPSRIEEEATSQVAETSKLLLNFICCDGSNLTDGF